MDTLIFNQFKQLARTLYFVIPMNKWILLAGLLLVSVGSLVQWQWHMPIVLIIGFAVVSMFFIITSFHMPSQLVAMVSSRQLGSLAHIRVLSCLVLVLNSLLTALLIVSFLVFKETMILTLSGFVAVFVTLMLLQLFAVWASQKILAQLMLWSLWFVAIPMGEWFFARPLWLPLAILGAALLVFLSWWTNWKPAYYIKNMAGASQADINALQAKQAGLLHAYLVTRPKTLAGTLLMGAHDSYAAYFKRGMIPLMFIAAAYLCAILLLDASEVMDLFNGLVGILFCILISAYGSSLVLVVFKNFKRVWLLTGLPRAQLFHYVESVYYPYLGFGALPGVVAAVVIALMFEPVMFTLDRVIFYLLGSLIISCVVFYLGLIVYQSRHASLLVLGWLNGLVYLAGFGYIFYLTDWHSPEPVKNLLSLSAGTLLGGVLLIFLLRSWAQKTWQKVDFKGVQ